MSKTLHTGINKWDEENRPREKLLAKGADALTNAELLAILIGSGNAEKDAVSLMQEMLDDQNGDFGRFCRMNYEDFIQYKGIGPAKAITLLAALQIAQRRAEREAKDILQEKLKPIDAEGIYSIVYPKMRDLKVESCRVIAIDNQLHYISDEEISRGGLTATVVDIRRVLKYAISKDATCIALCHNHPSGSPAPSREDDDLTQRLRNACTAIGIRMLDHIIVGRSDYYSYFENGKL